jgi:hypothetical protein
MDERARFEAWWLAAPEGGSSYEQVYGRSYREVAYLAWAMAAEVTAEQTLKPLLLPKSYGGSTFSTWGDQKEGCTVCLHFTDAKEAEEWVNRLTDRWDAARSSMERK